MHSSLVIIDYLDQPALSHCDQGHAFENFLSTSKAFWKFDLETQVFHYRKQLYGTPDFRVAIFSKPFEISHFELYELKYRCWRNLHRDARSKRVYVDFGISQKDHDKLHAQEGTEEFENQFWVFAMQMNPFAVKVITLHTDDIWDGIRDKDILITESHHKRRYRLMFRKHYFY